MLRSPSAQGGGLNVAGDSVPLLGIEPVPQMTATTTYHHRFRTSMLYPALAIALASWPPGLLVDVVSERDEDQTLYV